MPADDQGAWVEHRRRAVAGHAAAYDAARAAEAAEAARLIAGFVAAAGERGLRTTALRARAMSGRATYRTRLRGWYLKANRSIAVGVDGAFYVLEVPDSIRARVTGAEVAPSTPRLEIGAGGRDGESLPLSALLRRRLDAGDNWP